MTHTIPLWAAAALTVAAMVAQDFLGTGLTISMTRNLAWLPGTFDGLGDYASRIGQALTAGAYVAHGLWAWQTQLLLFLTAVTSFSTTNAATPLMSRLLPAGPGVRSSRRRRSRP